MTRRVPLLGRRLVWFGPALALAVAIFAGGMLAARLAAPEEHATATVVAREHRLPGRTYTTTIIDRRPVAISHPTGEQWFIGLALHGSGQEAVASVAQDLFARLTEGQSVAVTYREGLFSDIEILSVEPRPEQR